MSEIDAYMDLDPLEMSKADLDKIIAHIRKFRQQAEGGKVRRSKKDTGPKQTVSVSLKDLGMAEAPKVGGISRRI